MPPGVRVVVTTPAGVVTVNASLPASPPMVRCSMVVSTTSAAPAIWTVAPSMVSPVTAVASLVLITTLSEAVGSPPLAVTAIPASGSILKTSLPLSPLSVIVLAVEPVFPKETTAPSLTWALALLSTVIESSWPLPFMIRASVPVPPPASMSIASVFTKLIRVAADVPES